MNRLWVINSIYNQSQNWPKSPHFTPPMIIKNERTVKFTFQLTKILSVTPAFDNTFVLLGCVQPASKEVVLHLSKYGRQLYRFISKEPINTLTMTNDHTVVFCDIQQCRIKVINLKQQSIRVINHDFIGDTTGAIQIYYFSMTHLFCVIERGSFCNHCLSVTYYAEGKHEIVDQTMFHQGEYEYRDVICKGDRHSKIMWGRKRLEKGIILYTYEIGPQSKGNLKVIKVRVVPIEIQIYLDIAGISNMWYVGKNQLYLVCTSKKEHYQNRIVPFFKVYVVNSDKLAIRQSLIPFNFDHPQVPLEAYHLGQYSVFLTFPYYSGDNYIESILNIAGNDEELLQAMAHKIYSPLKMVVPDYQENSLIITEFPSPSTFKATTFKVLVFKDTLLHFMLHMNDQFDDDLLYDSINLHCFL